MERTLVKHSLVKISEELDSRKDPSCLQAMYGMLRLHIQTLNFPLSFKSSLDNKLSSHLNELSWIIRSVSSEKYPCATQPNTGRLFKAIIHIVDTYAV